VFTDIVPVELADAVPFANRLIAPDDATLNPASVVSLLFLMERSVVVFDGRLVIEIRTFAYATLASAYALPLVAVLETVLIHSDCDPTSGDSVLSQSTVPELPQPDGAPVSSKPSPISVAAGGVQFTLPLSCSLTVSSAARASGRSRRKSSVRFIVVTFA
jgi:hypothetical protein